jgi:hypothetical protein
VAEICWRRTRYERKAEENEKIIRANNVFKKEKPEMYRELIEEEW